MVPVRVPIIDYENPCYCPNPLHPRSAGAGDAGTYIGRSISSISRKSAATAAYKHRGARNRDFDMETSSPSIHALVNARKRIMEGGLFGETWPRIVVGLELAHDSSPHIKFSSSSSLDRRRLSLKRARNAGPATRLVSSRIPDGEVKEPHSIKQEYSSPILPLPIQVERKYQVPMEEFKEVPVSDPEDIVTTRMLLLRLEEVFPRIGFKDAADSVQHIHPEANAEYRSERHQALVDLLGERGALNENVLTALRDAEFCRLELGPTMRGVNKLDMPRGDVMRAFSQSGWFKNLKTLSFAGGRFRGDIALAHIRPCHRIENLILADTGIGNEGVFHIVAFKFSLRYLDLSGNSSINDDSIPALILLENLQYLSVFRTGVLMPGLRKLAVAMKDERVMDIKIPSACKDYIDTMDKQYMLHPAPPLISDPSVVGTLSKMALVHNLEAHKASNPSIVCTGPRNEMEERLRKILEVRTLDTVVREMLLGSVCEDL